tara:strand:- start:4186 stop:5904 length:1719 start_codon:yes stop_codon:yes gene_type:complete
MSKLDSLFASTILALALSVGCTTSDPTFCDENTPCTDPSAPFCDLAGAVGTKNTCTAPLFDAAPTVATITVELAGQGIGSVSSSDGSLECLQSPCTFDVEFGTTLRFLAAADEGTSFVTWSGPCEGFGECEFTADASQTLVAVLEPEGSLLWTQKPERSVPVDNQVSRIFPTGIATNSDNDVVVVGSLVGTPDFGGGPLISGDPTFGSVEVFVAQYDFRGAHQWSNAYSGLGFSDDFAHAVRVNSRDEIVVSGFFGDALTFDGPGEALDGSSTRGFLARFNQEGAHLASSGFVAENVLRSILSLDENDEILAASAKLLTWFDDMGTQLRTVEPSENTSELRSSAVDGFGRAVVTGSLTDNIDFSPGVSGGNLSGGGNERSYIVKLNWDGTYHSGRVRNVDRIECVVSDPNGDGSYYIVGSLTETVDLQGGGGGVITPTGSRNAFVAKYGNGHAHIWSVHLPSTSESTATACALDPRGNLLVGGSFDTDVRLKPTGDLHTGPGVFVAKYSTQNGSLQWETIGKGDATIPALESDTVGRTNAAVQLNVDASFTIAGETIPADAAPNLLLMQLAP